MKQNNLKDIIKHQFKDGFRKGYAKGYQDGVPFAIKTYSSVLLLCLKDKFDFTPEQLKEVANHIDNQFDAINDGLVSFDDIITALKEEDGVEVTYNCKVSIGEKGDSHES